MVEITQAERDMVRRCMELVIAALEQPTPELVESVERAYEWAKYNSESEHFDRPMPYALAAAAKHLKGEG